MSNKGMTLAARLPVAKPKKSKAAKARFNRIEACYKELLDKAVAAQASGDYLVRRPWTNDENRLLSVGEVIRLDGARNLQKLVDGGIVTELRGLDNKLVSCATCGARFLHEGNLTVHEHVAHGPRKGPVFVEHNLEERRGMEKARDPVGWALTHRDQPFPDCVCSTCGDPIRGTGDLSSHYYNHDCTGPVVLRELYKGIPRNPQPKRDHSPSSCATLWVR